MARLDHNYMKFVSLLCNVIVLNVIIFLKHNKHFSLMFLKICILKFNSCVTKMTFVRVILV